MTAIRHSVGLSLNEDYYTRLAGFAEAHDWTVAHAARVIIRQFLDYQTSRAQSPARPAPGRRAPAVMAADHGAAPDDPDWP